ncbi:Uncharacterised protein [Mycobacteroides abscessus subsp. abscessus]|nr:Uncharacterised protein [Mycobacteroides abscessus subsp. abscessus]
MASTRHGEAPRLAATSSCSRGTIANAANKGRTTNGVKKVVSARITPAGLDRNSSGREPPVRFAISALTAPAAPYKNVKARVIRKEGSARTVSMRRPTNSEPGKGTNANTVARNVPSARQPIVVSTAMYTVVTRAC